MLYASIKPTADRRSALRWPVPYGLLSPKLVGSSSAFQQLLGNGAPNDALGDNYAELKCCPI